MVTTKAREGMSSRMKTTYTTYTTNTTNATNARNARNAIGEVARLARKRHEPIHGQCGDEKPIGMAAAGECRQSCRWGRWLMVVARVRANPPRRDQARIS